MENPEEILHSLEEFSKLKPKDIPRELEEYLCFVAKTGNPVYQWPTIKSLFREKLLNVITEFYETCPSVEIPPCPNVEIFNYDLMKNFILEKLDTFAAAPFTVQRICELLTTPRKEYNRIDKYMRALEKNILVVSTTEPGRRSTENGESIMNGLEPEHLPESSNSSHDINVEEMDESPSWPRTAQIAPMLFESSNNEETQSTEIPQNIEQQTFQTSSEVKVDEVVLDTTNSKSQEGDLQETVITCPTIDEVQQPYVSIEPVALKPTVTSQEADENQEDTSVNITALPTNLSEISENVESVENFENKNVEVQEIKETVYHEDDKPEAEKEEQLHLVTVPVDAICSESLSVPINPHIEVEKQCLPEVIPDKEEPVIQNIVLENNSLSDAVLQPQLNEENCENQSDTVENNEDKDQDTSQTVQNSEQPTVNESEAEQLTSTFDDQNVTEEPVTDASNCPEVLDNVPHILEPLKENETADSCTNKESKEISEADNIQVPEAASNLCITETSKTEETAMEVDISDEKPSDKEEPTSTSSAL